MNIILTSLLISLLAAACVWLMGRRDPGGKPWLTALCLSVLLVLPFLTLLPKWHVEVLGSVSAVASTSAATPWWLFVWVLGFLLMLTRITINHLSLSKWLRDSDVLDDPRWQEILCQSAAALQLKSLPELRVKTGLHSPVVAGLRRPVILMPDHAKDWSEETFEMAILHELGHVHRKDLWVRYAADIACALHWYNPLVWWMRAKLLSQCEYACDARVIAVGADAKTYVRALCEVIENAMTQSDDLARPAGVCAMADHAPLQTRVDRLMNHTRSGKPWAAATAAAITMSTALGLTLIRPAVTLDQGDATEPVSVYSQEEIDIRHTANPFPGN